MKILKKQTTGLFLMLCITLMLSAATPAIAGNSGLSIRTNGVFNEIEYNFGSLGISATNFTAKVAGVGCTTTFAINQITARYMPNYPKSSFYIGAESGSATATTTCGLAASSPTITAPSLGYIWKFDNGLDIDLGLRLRLLMVGYNF